MKTNYVSPSHSRSNTSVDRRNSAVLKTCRQIPASKQCFVAVSISKARLSKRLDISQRCLVLSPFKVPETTGIYMHTGFPAHVEVNAMAALSFSVELRVHLTIPVNFFSSNLRNRGLISASPVSPKRCRIDSVIERQTASP